MKAIILKRALQNFRSFLKNLKDINIISYSSTKFGSPFSLSNFRYKWAPLPSDGTSDFVRKVQSVCSDMTTEASLLGDTVHSVYLMCSNTDSE